MAIAPTSPHVDRIARPRFDGVEAELTPDYSFRELRPKPPAGASPERLGMMWHEVKRPFGASVKLSSTDGRSHKVHLVVESEDPRWRPQWVRWSFPTRQARELEGGDSLTAQDELFNDDRQLHL